MIITQTPLRVSLAGGGTDLAAYYEQREGFVVSAGIDKSVFVIVTGRYDDRIYVNYSRKEVVDNVDDLQHELVREAMRTTGVSSGVEVTMLSDIPSEGSGLGSSSSFSVGLLNAFHLYCGRQVPAAQLADEACAIEIDRCGKPIGKQDQYIAAFGGVCAFTFRRDGGVAVEPLGLSVHDTRRLADGLRLFYSEQTRSSTDVLTEQREATAQRLHVLDDLKELALHARDALLARDFDIVGKVLDESWRLKKTLASGITTSRLDEMHDLAMRSGATGAKVCGAGGGGFLMAYAPAGSRESLVEAMSTYRHMPIAIDRDGSKVILNYRRNAW